MSQPPRTGDRLDEGVVFGRYVLLERLGAGAMGVVYAALDPDLNRRVALKLLRTDRLGRPELAERLLREARAMAKVDHENVVAVHDVGHIGDRLYVAMEYIEGTTLREWFKRGPHPQDLMLDVMRQAGEGLAAAHRAGLVHRDFKPDNIMLDSRGRARVLDFGLVRDTGPIADRIDGDGPKLTAVGVRLGTPAYMAPEQHQGAPADARADQFAFCVALFEGLYGVRPFSGKTRNAIAIRILEQKIEPVPTGRERPSWQHRAILRGLKADPAARWPNMDELLLALFTDSQRIRRRKLGYGALGVGATLAIVTAVWFGARPDAEASCTRSLAAEEPVFDDATLEAVRDGNDPTLLETVTNARDSLAAARHELCIARLQGGRSSTWLDANERCLARVSSELAGLADAAHSLESERMHLLDPGNLVTRVAHCHDDVETTSASDEATSLRRELARARALRDADPEAATTFVRAQDDSLEGTDPEIAARVLLLDGSLARRRGDLETADDLLHRSIHLAITDDQDLLAAEAFLELGLLERTREDETSSRAFIGYARAALQRGGGDTSLQSLLDTL